MASTISTLLSSQGTGGTITNTLSGFRSGRLLRSLCYTIFSVFPTGSKSAGNTVETALTHQPFLEIYVGD
jgi:hypothetical protein